MRKKYVLVGTGGRASMYLNALCGDFKDAGEIAALCDINPGRMNFWNTRLRKQYGVSPLPEYTPDAFDRMISEVKPDAVIVTSIDRTHHSYICRAMESGCDVISEKPMTVDAEKCQQIIDTLKRTGKHLRVTFNYRYSPRNSKVCEILRSGEIGEITSVHFEWLLSTEHGSDYFRRWHRDKRNSGGLLVHKATHHFDLVNWWINSSPEMVFACGSLRFYGRENAEKRGVTQFYSRSRDNRFAASDPFALHVGPKDDWLRGLYYDNEQYDGYCRDQSVFGDGISIEDNMALLVRYRNQAIMSYSLNAHAPWEGYRVAFNGTMGRLEFNVVEVSELAWGGVSFNQEPGFLDISADAMNTNGGVFESTHDRLVHIPEIILQSHWGKPREISYEAGAGGHGGGDNLLLDDIFRGGRTDPLHRAADCRDGVLSILTGIAANISIKTGLPVDVETLVKF